MEGADEEDIYLDEFSDEIDSWVIDALKNIGCYTAKSVLAMRRDEIIERADLEEQTVDDLLAILSAEFDDADDTDEIEAFQESEGFDIEAAEVVDTNEPVEADEPVETDESVDADDDEKNHEQD